MNLITIAKQRYATRRFANRAVEPEKLALILEAAHVAPTAGNRQPVRLLVVQSAEGLAKLEKATRLYHAPLAIIACVDRSKAWTRSFDGKQTCEIDASILTDHMMLQATELGLGSVWICAFDPKVAREELQLPENLEPVNILAVGYAQNAPASPDRHRETRIALEELVSYEQF